MLKKLKQKLKILTIINAIEDMSPTDEANQNKYNKIEK